MVTREEERACRSRRFFSLKIFAKMKLQCWSFLEVHASPLSESLRRELNWEAYFFLLKTSLSSVVLFLVFKICEKLQLLKVRKLLLLAGVVAARRHQSHRRHLVRFLGCPDPTKTSHQLTPHAALPCCRLACQPAHGCCCCVCECAL